MSFTLGRFRKTRTLLSVLIPANDYFMFSTPPENHPAIRIDASPTMLVVAVEMTHHNTIIIEKKEDRIEILEEID